MEPGVPGRQDGRDARPSIANPKLFCCFFVDNDLQVRGHVLVQLDGDNELADSLERFVQLDLPPIDMEALLLERVGNIAGRDRSEQVIAFA
jgi:hypothetical protein